MNGDKPASPPENGLKRVTKRMQRRAVVDLAVSIAMLLGLGIASLGAHLPGWFVVLGALLVVQAAGYAVFAYRVKFDMATWRQSWARMLLACGIWSAAVAATASQISVVFLIVWLVFASLWIGAMAFVYVKLRRRQSAA